jgi:cytochrome P450/NADPH-cytochrome P450 reductase
MANKNKLDPIPRPEGIPVLGNILSVNSDAPLQSLMEHAKAQGPIFWLDMLGTPIMIVSGPELVKELCDETRFDKTVRGPLKRVRAIGGDGLFTGDTKDPNWSKAHNILMPTFAQKAMEEYLPMMSDIAEQLMLKWERLNADEDIDVVRDMTGLALDTIGLCGFDYRFNSFYREDFHPFIDALNRTLETCMNFKGIPFERALKSKNIKQMDNDVAFMNELVDQIIKERRRGGGQQKDLLNFMLAGEDPVSGEKLSDENIRYQINTFLIAGHETTSGLLSFTLHYLLKHPKVLARAHAEVDTILGNDIGRTPTIAQIGKLEYTRAVLLEALRLWPTAPAFSVSPFKDEIIGGKYPVPKDTFVTILIPSLHRDEEIWGPDPDGFDPDRFSREAEATRPSYAYKPFGNGQRACIGRQFALQEAVLVLGMILQRFKLFDHQSYELNIKETLSLKPDGFRIKARLREGLVRTQGPIEATPETTPTVKRPKHGGKLTILYGSNLGTAEGYAHELAQMGDIYGFDTHLAELDDFTDNLPTSGAVIIVTASYNGAPPNNAVKFVNALESAKSDFAKGVTYTVFGCGNRDWASTFQTIPRLIDQRLEELGGTRFTPCGEGDAREDLSGQFHEWFDTLWPELGKTLDLDIDFTEATEASPLYDVEITESVTANPVAMQAGAIPMTIVANRELQDKEASKRSTRHIEVKLPDGVNYLPGDHLCVVPVNGPDLVKRALKRFGFDAETYIRVNVDGGRRSPFPNGSTFSLKHLAEVYGELQAVATRKDIEILASHTRCPDTKKKLQSWTSTPDSGADLYRDEVLLKRRSILNILELYPACELPFAIYLEMIPFLTPRYYSISSAPTHNPGHCTITVGVVEGEALSGDGIYQGISSNYLARSNAGDVIQAVIKEPISNFRLPEDPSIPVIMIGPGTGLAPFRGFIQARQNQKDAGKTLGPALLFFGCRHSAYDFIYQDELEAAEKDNLIDLHTAFSREIETKTYVQDKLREQADKVWNLIESGAVIYVCGDGASMEPSVKAELIAMHSKATNSDEGESAKWIEELSETGRYVLDVWAG